MSIVSPLSIFHICLGRRKTCLNRIFLFKIRSKWRTLSSLQSISRGHAKNLAADPSFSSYQSANHTHPFLKAFGFIMSSPSVNGENQKLLSGRRLGKALEKSNFAQTCSLLSQFMREKRSLGDSSFARVECEDQDPEESRTTFNLLRKMENPADYSKQNSGPAAVDFLPQLLCSGSPAAIDNPSSNVDSSKRANPEAAAAQMTIFYCGKVVVFDDFPAEKAEEIMAMAINGVSTKTSNCNDVVPASSNGEKLSPKQNMETKPATETTQEHAQRQPQPNASDMPIARRTSLHRFLEKRKDRATSRAPYQVNPAAQPEFSSKSGKSLDLNF